MYFKCNHNYSIHKYSYLNRVTVGESIKTKCLGIILSQELCPYLKLRMTIIHTQVLYP